MAFPFCALDTDPVIASHVFCRFCTAIHARLTIGTYLNTVSAFAAGIAEICTVRAEFTAFCTKVICAVPAIIAVPAHAVGTVKTNAAIGAEFVRAAGAFSAFFADIFGTVGTNNAAVLANLRTVAALIAVLTEQLVGAFTADITGSAEFVAAVGAFLAAFGAKIGAVFASFPARADNAAIRAEAAVYAEAVRAGAIHAFAAFRAHFSVGAVRAFFTALHTDGGTVCTALTAGADHLDTGDTEHTLRTEIAFSYAVHTEAAVNTYFTVGALRAVFTAVGTNVSAG